MSTGILDCRPANFSSLSASEQSRYMDGEQIEDRIATISGHILLACEVEGIKGVAVATTHAELEDLMIGFTKKKNEARACFEGALRNITRYRSGTNDLTDQLYEQGGQEWENFLQDLKIYYCARAVLFQRPIPILGNVPRDRVIPEGINKWRSMNDLPTCDSLPDAIGVVNENPRRNQDPDVVSATIVEEDSNDEMTQAEADEYNARCCVECGEVKETDCECDK